MGRLIPELSRSTHPTFRQKEMTDLMTSRPSELKTEIAFHQQQKAKLEEKLNKLIPEREWKLTASQHSSSSDHREYWKVSLEQSDQLIEIIQKEIATLTHNIEQLQWEAKNVVTLRLSVDKAQELLNFLESPDTQVAPPEIKTAITTLLDQTDKDSGEENDI